MDIHCKVVGQGKRNVLLLHGFSADHRLMMGAMEPIFKKRSGFKRYYVDLPGHGKSKVSSEINTSHDVLNSLKDFVAQKMQDQEFLVCGQSYGGYLSIALLQEVFLQIKGLLLLCPRMYNPLSSRPPKEVLFSNPRFMGTLSEFERKEFQDVAVIETEYIFKRFKKEIISGLKIADYDFLLNKLKKNKDTYNLVGYSLEKFKNIVFPTLILCGKQDHIVGYREAMEFSESFCRCTAVVLDAAGHNLHLEQPKIFESLAHEWLDRVEAHWVL